jgi:Pyridine nucleotide-disulphide oxidoreductase
VFLASRGSDVALLLRGNDLTAGMSHYLVDQIQRTPSITVSLRTEIRTLHGEESLDGVTVEHTDTHTLTHMPLAAAFIFIGANPHTDWLREQIATDEHGFILTGLQLGATGYEGPREPLPLETSLPGVFAVGDVRSGSSGSLQPSGRARCQYGQSMSTFRPRAPWQRSQPTPPATNSPGTGVTRVASLRTEEPPTARQSGSDVSERQRLARAPLHGALRSNKPQTLPTE